MGIERHEQVSGVVFGFLILIGVIRSETVSGILRIYWFFVESGYSHAEGVIPLSPGSRVLERTLGYKGPQHDLPRRGMAMFDGLYKVLKPRG